MTTKLNVNIRKMLSSCEIVQKKNNMFRLQELVELIEPMIDELVAMDDPQSVNYIAKYRKRLNEFKILTENYNGTTNNESTNLSDPDSDTATQEKLQIQKAAKDNELRTELLKKSDTLRLRRGADDGTSPAREVTGGNNLSKAVNYYHTAQEKITEHMLTLTRNLKEQTETANRIIKRDTEIVSRSTGVADRNLNSLAKEADRLEQHSRKAMKCWLWLMFVFVIMIFIFMVIFMKIMKKKKA